MVEPLRDRSSEEYKAAMAHLYDDRSDADLTIICGDKMVKVHSLALWPRSPYFHRMCKGGFKEASTGIIELKEEDPFLLGRMLSYCYMMGWTSRKHEDETTWISDLDTMVRMYTVGDKYDIQGLKEEAKERFSEHTSQINSKLVYDFLGCLPKIYQDVLPHDRELRNAAVIFGTKIWQMLWSIPEFKDNLNGYDDFINDVVMQLREESFLDMECQECGSTGKWVING
ncbi:hypothetical protein N7G274_000273 [Stereocaulon virgatum]|uniref:BTB domain-containing protein n=1 Tax=Stereocaulon virgatum TaxID=373712 RepID=A0ABR4AU20_9LECA